jgi:hypothetical protein
MPFINYEFELIDSESDHNFTNEDPSQRIEKEISVLKPK